MDSRKLEIYFGKTVCSKRKENKITQEQLAELVGISTTYLRCVEHGKNSISWKLWLRICVVLQIDVKELMDKILDDDDYMHL